MLMYCNLGEDGRVLVTTDIEEYSDEESILFEFPDDFEFIKQDHYCITDGQLIYNPLPPSEAEVEHNREQTYRNQMDLATTMYIRSANLTDDEALEVSMLYPEWSGKGVFYKKGDRVNYNGQLYNVLDDHESRRNWSPAVAPSLYAVVLPGQSGDIGEWIQPESTNPYKKGDKVTHKNKTWISDIDNNVWEPGVFGWTEI